MAFRRPATPKRERTLPQPVAPQHRRPGVRMATPELLAGPAAAPQPAAPVRKAAKRRATPAESEHMGRVKRLACVLCAALGQQQESATDVHHIREEQGGAQRASHWLVAALCHAGCHQGPRGVHGDRSLLRQAKCTEIDLLAMTLAALARPA